MLTQVSKTGKIQKEVFIIRRYEIKRGMMAGSICNVVRSIKTVKGEQVVNEYQVWTLRDGVTTCDCPSKVPCCHMDEVSFSEMRRCNNIAPVAPRQVAQPVVKARELRNRFCLGEYTPQYRDPNGDWQDFKDGQGRSIFFLGGHEDLAREFIKVDSDECRSAVLAELQRMFDEQNAAYEAEQARKTAQSQRRIAAPLNGPRGFQLCKSWAQLEAERAAKKQAQEEKAVA